MEIRTTPEFSTVTENKLEGYAIVFNRTSNILYDKASRKFFTETILPEAVDYDTISRSDILMLINHNKERMLARSRFGEGSLKLEIDDLGVRFSFDIPKIILLIFFSAALHKRCLEIYPRFLTGHQVLQKCISVKASY